MSVKRWTGRPASLEEDRKGGWVEFSDYQSLQAALREALDMLDGELAIDLPYSPYVERSAALRAQFLDDHPSKEPS